MVLSAKRCGIAVCLMLTAIAAADRVSAAASMMIWPITPVIESTDRAAAIWLENQGTAPVTLQIRVLAWTTRDYDDYYIDQRDEIVASPPVATIAAGRRQLIRLIKLREPASGRQMAYRVFVDELPSPTRAGEAARVEARTTSMGVTMRMRYSLPLFVFGAGLTDLARTAPNGTQAAGTPLAWRVVRENGKRWLYVHNRGPVYVRLSRVRLVYAGPREVAVAGGLLGYVLPGAERRWPLPDGPATVAETGAEVALVADVNGRTSVSIAGG